MAGYNYQGALQAGANPTDVINYMASQTGYNAAGALSAGANPSDVMSYMANMAPKTPSSGSGDLMAPWATPSSNDSPIMAGLKTAANFIPSLVNTGAGMVKSVTGLPGELSGIASNAYQGVQEQGLGKFALNTAESVPGAILNTAEGIVPAIKPILAGDWSGAAQSMEANPVGNIAPIVGGVEGGAEGLADRGIIPKSVPEAVDTGITKTAQAVTKPVAAVVNPIARFMAGKAADTAAFTTAQATGLEPSTIKTVMNNPADFTKEAIGSTDRMSVAQQVESALNTKIAALDETGKQYAPVRNSITPITVDPEFLDKVITDNTGLSIKSDPTGETGKIMTNGAAQIRDPGDVRAIQNFYNMWKPIFGTGKMTPNEFLNMRTDLANMSNFESPLVKRAPVEASAQRMRGQLNSEYRPQIPGLGDTTNAAGNTTPGLDSQFGDQAQELKTLRKGIIDKNGNLTDTAINKIANATGKGRDKVLERLEQTVPGITKKIQVLKAVEDIHHAGGHKVGTYARSAVESGGILGGIMTGNPALIAAGLAEAIISNPKIAVPLLRKAAATGEMTSAVLARLKGYLNGINTIPQKIQDTKLSLPGLPTKNREGGFISAGGAKAPIYAGETDLTTRVLQNLEGKSLVSRQYIEDLTNQAQLRQPERELIRSTLENFKGDSIPVKEFANKVKTELLPLERSEQDEGNMGDFFESEGVVGGSGKYESVTLPEDQRGNVQNYSEHIYQSPIKTSAGDIHFDSESYPNYFAHTRVEDMPNGVRRVIESQSDLFQKEGLEKEVDQKGKDVGKLYPYRNTWQERIAREEIQQAAKDGKTEVQFPTGETAMKIEGIGNSTLWADADNTAMRLTPDTLKVGKEIVESRPGNNGESLGNHWIITDVIGDGKFKAIPKNEVPRRFDYMSNGKTRFEDRGGQRFLKEGNYTLQDWINDAKNDNRNETFDISGKMDTSNPIHKFYEKELGKYLTSKFGAQRVTDDQGVSWYSVPITKDMANKPVLAFGHIAKSPLMVGAGVTAGGAALVHALTANRKSR